MHVGFFGTQNGGQAEMVRVPYADGTLVQMPEAVARDERKRNATVALCDVMGTGHYGLVAAETKPGSDVVVVGDGAAGLCAVLSAAKEIRAERVSASYMTFEPCARTNWHTHPLGQRLIVTSGFGRVRRWGGPAREETERLYDRCRTNIPPVRR